MPLPFEDWKSRLFSSAGCASPSVRQLGDFVLELFWRDGCEPTIGAMLDYAQAGLCGKVPLQAGEEVSSPSYKPNAPPRSSPDSLS
jgi:hypothetical protein